MDRLIGWWWSADSRSLVDGGQTADEMVVQLKVQISHSVSQSCTHVIFISPPFLPPTFCPFVLLASFACYIVITSNAAAAAAAVDVSTRVHRDEAWTAAAAAAVIKSAVTQWDWQWRDKVRLLLLLLFQLIQCSKEKIDCQAKDLLLSVFFGCMSTIFSVCFNSGCNSQSLVGGLKTGNCVKWRKTSTRGTECTSNFVEAAGGWCESLHCQFSQRWRRRRRSPDVVLWLQHCFNAWCYHQASHLINSVIIIATAYFFSLLFSVLARKRWRRGRLATNCFASTMHKQLHTNVK